MVLFIQYSFMLNPEQYKTTVMSHVIHHLLQELNSEKQLLSMHLYSTSKFIEIAPV